MLPVSCTHVEVYVFRRRARRVEFLALRRSRDRAKLPGVWQPVTGKIDPGEGPLAAAVREVAEETGLHPKHWWALESASLYYDVTGDRVLALPLFAAEVGSGARVHLSEEHDEWAFLSTRDAAARWLWNQQRRALERVREEVLRGGRVARARALRPDLHGPRRRIRVRKKK